MLETGSSQKRDLLAKRLSSLFTTRGTTILLAVICSLIVYQFILKITDTLEATPEAKQDLSGTWEVCLPSQPSTSRCIWHEVEVPSSLPDALEVKADGWLIYRTRFTAPDSCLQPDSSCALFLQEVGDTVEGQINGITIGRHGEFPPKPTYAKHYPALFDLSRNLLKPGNNANELVLIVYSLKKVQAGLRRGPVGIYSNINAYQVTQSAIARDILVPIMTAICLFIIAIIGTAVAAIRDIQDQKIHSYIRYCFTTALFMGSFSEIPREYLPIGVAGFIHVALRLLSSWAYFNMVSEYFEFSSKVKTTVHKIYALVILFVGLAFIFELISESSMDDGAGFDVAVKILRWCFPSLLLPHVSGLAGAIGNKLKKSKSYFIAFFVILILFQIHDTLVFNGFIVSGYFGKFYPVFIAIVFGLYYFEKSREEWSRTLIEREKIKHLSMFQQLVSGLVHEFRAPCAGLAMARDEVVRNPNNTPLVKEIVSTLPTYTDKILSVTKDIFEYSKDLTQGVRLHKTPGDATQFAERVIQGLKTETNGRIHVELITPVEALFVSFDQIQMERVLVNLIRNSIDACSKVNKPRIIVSVKQGPSAELPVEFIVEDNGPGIPPTVLDSLFSPFCTYGKDGGVGLGLAFSMLIVEAHGGTLTFQQLSGLTRFVVRL